MTPSKQKGTAAETAVVNYLRDEHAIDAHRHALHGTADVGDIFIPGSGVVIEVKACKTMALAQWVDETETERYRMEDSDLLPIKFYGLTWHKRRGRSNPRDWYVTLPGWQAVELLKEAGRV